VLHAYNVSLVGFGPPVATKHAETGNKQQNCFTVCFKTNDGYLFYQSFSISFLLLPVVGRSTRLFAVGLQVVETFICGQQ
jgi:hypothetical protein